MKFYKEGVPGWIFVTANHKDITDTVMEKYGENCDCDGKLWRYHEVFSDCEIGDNINFEFISEDGRRHWFNTFIYDKNQYFNPSLLRT